MELNICFHIGSENIVSDEGAGWLFLIFNIENKFWLLLTIKQPHQLQDYWLF